MFKCAANLFDDGAQGNDAFLLLSDSYKEVVVSFDAQLAFEEDPDTPCTPKLELIDPNIPDPTEESQEVCQVILDAASLLKVEGAGSAKCRLSQ